MKAMKCKCEHKFQDGEYGNGVRAHNPCKLGSMLRCTVCGNEKKKVAKEA